MYPSVYLSVCLSPTSALIFRSVEDTTVSLLLLGTGAYRCDLLGLIEHGFTSAPTQYRLYGRRFLQV